MNLAWMGRVGPTTQVSELPLPPYLPDSPYLADLAYLPYLASY